MLIISYKEICRGCHLILWGLIEILVIACRISAVVDGILNKESIGAIFLLGGIFLYVAELYFIFCGAWNVISGIAECLGKKLSRNPYNLKEKNNLSMVTTSISFVCVVLLKFKGMTTTFLNDLNLILPGVELSVFNIKRCLLGLGIDKLDYVLLAVMMLIASIIGVMHIKGFFIREWIDKRNIVVRWAIYYSEILLLAVCGYYGVQG